MLSEGEAFGELKVKEEKEQFSKKSHNLDHKF